MKKLVIGSARIIYNEDGTTKEARFFPDIAVDLLPTLEEQLKKIPCTTQEALKENAELVLGAWWNKMNEIELRNHELTDIVSKITMCEKFPDGKVRQVVIEYTFMEKVASMN